MSASPTTATFFRNGRATASKPDGVALVHTIGRDAAARASPTPGSRSTSSPAATSPPLSEVLPAIEKAGLWVTDIEILRLHYAETLRHWRERFVANRDEVARALRRALLPHVGILPGSPARLTFRHTGNASSRCSSPTGRRPCRSPATTSTRRTPTSTRRPPNSPRLPPRRARAHSPPVPPPGDARCPCTPRPAPDARRVLQRRRRARRGPLPRRLRRAAARIHPRRRLRLPRAEPRGLHLRPHLALGLVQPLLGLHRGLLAPPQPLRHRAPLPPHPRPHLHGRGAHLPRRRPSRPLPPHRPPLPVERRWQTLPPGTVLTREGAPVDRLTYIASGAASVIHGGTEVATIPEGLFVGELGVLSRAPATATVTITAPTRAFTIPAAPLAALVAQTPRPQALPRRRHRRRRAPQDHGRQPPPACPQRPGA